MLVMMERNYTDNKYSLSMSNRRLITSLILEASEIRIIIL